MINRIISGIFVIISIILGIIISNIFADGSLPYVRNVTKAVIILGSSFIAALATTTIVSYFTNNIKLKATLISPGILLLLSSIGSVVTGMLALSTNIIPTTTPVIVLVGFIAFFSILMVLTFVQFIISLIYRTNC